MYTDLNGNYNRTGLNSSTYEWTGYSLLINNFISPTSLGPGISLIKFDPIGDSFATTLKYLKIKRSPISGNHHIDITRDQDGLIKIYLYMILQFELTDTTTDSSEKFGITSWVGQSTIDNIRVSDLVEMIEPPIGSTPGDSDDTSDENDSPITIYLLFLPFFGLLNNKKFRKQ